MADRAHTYDLYRLTMTEEPDAEPTYWAVGKCEVAKFTVQAGNQPAEHLETGEHRVRWHRLELTEIEHEALPEYRAEHLGAFDTLDACRQEIGR